MIDRASEGSSKAIVTATPVATSVDARPVPPCHHPRRRGDRGGDDVVIGSAASSFQRSGIAL
jgi:hypothetical protein